jgi:hypothetical protein
VTTERIREGRGGSVRKGTLRWHGLARASGRGHEQTRIVVDRHVHNKTGVTLHCMGSTSKQPARKLGTAMQLNGLGDNVWAEGGDGKGGRGGRRGKIRDTPTHLSVL